MPVFTVFGFYAMDFSDFFQLSGMHKSVLLLNNMGKDLHVRGNGI